jgi:hypothetical protein
MNQEINIKLQVFSKYIGQPVWLNNLREHKEVKHRVGLLTGVRTDALQVMFEGSYRWIALDASDQFEIKLLLKPLSRLTDTMKEIANSLPVTVFITQYYVQMGFDMPVFISPGHPLNCKYASELGLADYRLSDEILALNSKESAYAA